MNRERKSAARLQTQLRAQLQTQLRAQPRAQLRAQRRRNRPLPSTAKTRRCRGAMTTSLGFYLGIGILLLLLVAGALVLPSPRPLADQHANPVPASPLPAQVVISPGSHLYHAGARCFYVHRDSKRLSTSEAIERGLVPCPYCIGNSSARPTPR
jgi:hypothetical protein